MLNKKIFLIPIIVVRTMYVHFRKPFSALASRANYSSYRMEVKTFLLKVFQRNRLLRL